MRKILMVLVLVLSDQLIAAQDTLAPIVANYLQQAGSLADSARFEAALAIDHEALALYENYPLRDDSLLADVYNDISVQHYFLGDYRQAIHWMEKVLATRQQLYPDSSVQIAMAYNNIGVFHFHRGDYRSASEFYQQALDRYARSGEERNVHLSECFLNVGACYALMGDLEMAKVTLEKGLAVLLNSAKGDYSFLLNSYYNNLGSLNSDMGFARKGIEYYNKALLGYKSFLNEDHPELLEVLTNIGLCHLNDNDLDQAEATFKKILKTQKESLGSRNPTISETYIYLAKVNSSRKNFIVAKIYLERAMELLKSDPLVNSPKKLDVKIRMAELDLLQGNFHQAKDHLESVLSQFSLGKAKENLDFSQVSSLPLLLSALDLLGETSRSLWKEEQDSNFLFESIEIGNITLDLLDHLRYNFTGDISKISVIEDHIYLFERQIENLIDASKITDRDDYLNLSYQVMERAQCRQLLERTRQQQAISYARVPGYFRDTIRELAIALTLLENEINDLKAEGVPPTDKMLTQKFDQRFKFRQEREQIFAQIEKEYPLYYQMQYDPSIVDIEYLQDSLLQTGQAILSYFEGLENYYLFMVTKQAVQMYPLHTTERINQMIEDYRRFLSKSPNRSTHSQVDTLMQISRNLHEILLGPLDSLLPEQLIIIPGGQLALLPFNTLIKSGDKQGSEYLLYHHKINYIYSATWLKTRCLLPESRSTHTGLLAIAPEFNSNVDIVNLNANVFHPELKHHQTEVESIQRIIRGTLLKGKAATVSSFLANAGKFRWIHLATHAVVDGDNDRDSYLAFSGAGDDNRLSLPEIYNLDLKADLVVLSACETGLGKMRAGEGVFSLARAFSYAGAKSLVTSLWRVDDQSTQKIMTEFYRQLATGKNKDEALRRAQLHFLANCRQSERHPFHWAAFVPYGQMDPIFTENTSFAKLWILILGILLFLGVVKKGKIYWW